MNDFVSRGFSGRRRTREELADRLPPGQHYDVRLTAPAEAYAFSSGRAGAGS
jgi:hypothetical protein